MSDFEKYMRTETKFSAIGSIVVTVLFYVLVFGIMKPVAIRGMGNYAFDFLPQSFMTALICTLLPGIVTRKRLKSGTITIARAGATAQGSLLVGGLIYGFAALIVGGLGVAGLLYLSGVTTIGWTLGLAGKIGFAGIVAIIVTPAGLRRLLGSLQVG